ncbi:MAG: hypothetical protein WCP80_05815 [Phycisphaerales bacterium]|jgi:hypothetical protein
MSKKIQIALLHHAASASAPCDSILKRVDQMARLAKEEGLIGKCEFARVQEMRRSWTFLGDRRFDAHDALTQRFRDGAN